MYPKKQIFNITYSAKNVFLGHISIVYPISSEKMSNTSFVKIYSWRRHAQTVGDGALSYKIEYVTRFLISKCNKIASLLKKKLQRFF